VSDSLRGHGLQVWKKEVLGHTVTIIPSGEEGGFDSIVLHDKSSIIEVPEDASPEMRADLGKHHILEKVGSVDRASKTFTLKSAKLISTTMDRGNFTLDTNFEHALSANNMIIRRHSLNRNGAQAFFFQDDSARPVLCPSLAPPRGPSLERKMREVMEFLTEAVLYTPGEPRVVEFKLVWHKLSKIDTLETQFDAKVFLELRWLLGSDDVYRYIYQPEGWKPEWSPGEVAIMNMASDGAASVQVDAVKLQKVDSRVYAVQVMEVCGSFFEVFELESFPADVQLLNIELQMQGPKSMTFLCIQSGNVNESVVQASEWRPLMTTKGHNHTVSDVGNTVGSSDSVRHSLTITAYVGRKSFVFVVRIIFIMTLLSGLALSAFAFKPKEDFGDQMSNCLTLLLTAVAYSLVVAGSLPVLGYLTFLDKYILASLLFISLVIVQVIALRCIEAETEEALDMWSANTAKVDAVLLGCAVAATLAKFARMARRGLAKVPLDGGGGGRARPAEPRPGSSEGAGAARDSTARLLSEY